MSGVVNPTVARITLRATLNRKRALLFALPAFLVVRREIALIGAFLVATYTFEGIWIGVLLVTAALGLAERYPALREPGRDLVVT